jgi:hypothetical protein
MRLTYILSALTLKGVILGTCRAAGVEATYGATDSVVTLLTRRFIDHSQSLNDALQRANQQAWRAVEVALAGEGFWVRLKVSLSSADD